MLYRKWSVINSIPDRNIRTGLALIDLASDYGEVLAGKFPECFSTEQAEGPIPLSVLIERARANARIDEDYSKALVCYHGADEIVTFDFCRDTQCDGERPLLPDELDQQIKLAEQYGALFVGMTFDWEGRQVVLLERSSCGRGHSDEYSFASAEAVVVDTMVTYNSRHDKRDHTVCPICEGKGGWGSDEPCGKCKGKGKIPL